MSKSILFDKSQSFAKKIVILTRYIAKQTGEKDMTNQLKRSATSIGANLAEAQFAESTSDFLHKLRIALKEANESKYWIELLWETGYLLAGDYKGGMREISAIIALLVKSVNTTLQNSKSK